MGSWAQLVIQHFLGNWKHYCTVLIAAIEVTAGWVCFQSLLRNYEVDIDDLSRKQKLSIEKVELAQSAECKAFNKKLRVEQVVITSGPTQAPGL